VGLVAVSVTAMAGAGAQGSRRSSGVVVQALTQRWEFTDTLRQDSLRIASVTQMSFPVTVILDLTGSWTMDVQAAYAMGAVQLAGGAELPLNGVTDVRARVFGPIVKDRIMLTLGFNGPVGTTNLDEDQVAALRVIGAPALRFAVPVFGSGLSGTAGLVLAQQVAGWSLAAGAAWEYRGRYSPIEALIAGETAITNLDPAEAMHYSLGADRLVGPHRLAVLWGLDRFGEDRLSIPGQGTGPDEEFGSYRLGDAQRFLAQVDLAAPRFRQLSAAVQWRRRAGHTDTDGALVAGSSGRTLDAQLSAVLGSPRGFGLGLRLEWRNDSGLDVDDSFVTAAMRARSATLGITIPFGSAFLEPFARFEAGTLDLGPQATEARGVTYGVRLAPR
jgi:hypothetical protein